MDQPIALLNDSDTRAAWSHSALDGLLAERERELETARSALDMLVALPDSGCLFIESGAGASQLMKRFRLARDLASWQELMTRSGLWMWMDAEARKRWRETFDHETNFRTVSYDAAPLIAPPFTREAVQEMFTRLYDERGAMFERVVVGLYKRLSWDYRSDLPVAFGPKLVVESVVQWCERYQRFGVGHVDHLDDLLRTMNILDGKPEPDHRKSAWDMLSDGKLDNASWRGYFSLKPFRNGNAHIRFTRLDLVDRLNVIVAKHYPGALPYQERQSERLRRR